MVVESIIIAQTKKDMNAENYRISHAFYFL